jgi:hypothetical protein
MFPQRGKWGAGNYSDEYGEAPINTSRAHYRQR